MPCQTTAWMGQYVHRSVRQPTHEEVVTGDILSWHLWLCAHDLRGVFRAQTLDRIATERAGKVGENQLCHIQWCGGPLRYETAAINGLLEIKCVMIGWLLKRSTQRTWEKAPLSAIAALKSPKERGMTYCTETEAAPAEQPNIATRVLSAGGMTQ